MEILIGALVLYLLKIQHGMIGLISLENQSLPLMVPFFTLGCARGFNKGELNQFISAASFILIIGAGGAFKNVWQELVNEAIASLATSFDIV
ncbi:hypothetical protein ACIQWQ_18340 [Peribacillus frigoritolerans]